MDQKEAQDMLRLIETVKYMIGIAERGEGRKIRDNETAEQFVLGYVKRLENALRMAADEPNIDKARAIADAVLVPNRCNRGRSEAEFPAQRTDCCC